MKKISVIDLKSILYYGHSFFNKQKGVANEYRKNCLCSNHGLFTITGISQMRKSISRKLQSSKILLLRSIPLYGFCATYLSRKFTRYRSLFTFGSKQTLPYRLSRQNFSQHFSKCKRKKRRAYIRRLRANLNSYCQRFICQRTLWYRFKTNYHRIYSQPINKTTGLKSDQIVHIGTQEAAKKYPEKIQKICFYDSVNKNYLIFLTNNFNLPAITITQLYKCRWQIELFFKWIKQHLRIKAFYGTSENAVKTQLWIAVSIYVLIAIIKKRLKIKMSLYTMLQILSITIFEKTPILQVLTHFDCKKEMGDFHNQLTLFDL